jgi:hypothetical protein
MIKLIVATIAIGIWLGMVVNVPGKGKTYPGGARSLGTKHSMECSSKPTVLRRWTQELMPQRQYWRPTELANL